MDFMPPYIVTPLHNDFEIAEQLFIRTVVKGFCMVHANNPVKSIILVCSDRIFDDIKEPENDQRNITRVLLFIGLVLYVASPVGCVPGPIEDAILMLMYIGISRRTKKEWKISFSNHSTLCEQRPRGDSNPRPVAQEHERCSLILVKRSAKLS